MIRLWTDEQGREWRRERLPGGRLRATVAAAPSSPVAGKRYAAVMADWAASEARALAMLTAAEASAARRSRGTAGTRGHAESALAAMARVRALHRPEPSYKGAPLCVHCRDVGLVATTEATYPCPTIRALEGATDEH